MVVMLRFCLNLNAMMLEVFLKALNTLQFQLVSEKISRTFFDIICFSLALTNIRAKATSLISDEACNV